MIGIFGAQSEASICCAAFVIFQKVEFDRPGERSPELIGLLLLTVISLYVGVYLQAQLCTCLACAGELSSRRVVSESGPRKQKKNKLAC